MIWDGFFFTLALALVAAFAVIPLLEHVWIGNPKTEFIGNELDMDHIGHDRCTVYCKSGVLFQVFHFTGTSFDALTIEAQEAIFSRRKHALFAIGRHARVFPSFFAVKRRKPLDIAADWPTDSLQEIGDLEQQKWTSSHATHWYVVLSSRSFADLEEAALDLKSHLAELKPERLESPEDTTKPCPLTGFLNGLVSGDFLDWLPRRAHSLAYALPAADMIFQEDGVVKSFGEQDLVHRVVTVREWGESLPGSLLSDLLKIDSDLEISQICEPWDRDKARVLMLREKNVQRSLPFFRNEAKIAEIEAIENMLTENEGGLFATQFCLVLRAPSNDLIEKKLVQVREVLAARGISFSVEAIGARTCWFQRLPWAAKRHGIIGPGSRLYRPLFLRGDNLATLWTFAKSPTGSQGSPFGAQPVRMFPTATGDAYRFQFHSSDKEKALGHFLVFAPSGGGKSTLIMYLLSGLAKFEGVRSIVFDSKDGARFMIEALGGHYQNYDSLALNPLDVGADTPKSRQRIMQMLRALCGTLSLTPEDQAELEAALPYCFDVEPPYRLLNVLYGNREHELAMFRKGSNLHRHFAKWVRDEKGNVGDYAHVFNAPHDSLGSLVKQFLVAINMNEALEDPVLGPPIVAHISSALARSAGQAGNGFAIFIDEAAKLLQNRGFEDHAAEMFREYRKQGGVVGMAFQDPTALAQSRHAAAFIENTATLIFLPNSNAKAASFAPFNLNDEHLAFVTGRSGIPGRKALVIKRDAVTGFEESVIIDVDLSWTGKAMRFFRGGVDAIRELEHLKEKEGQQWRQHLTT